jgi:hypothetical protein
MDEVCVEVNAVQSSSRILTPEECDQIIRNLDDCLALFARKQGLLNGAEVRAKSLLSLMRNEIARKACDGSAGPFD